MNFASRRLLGGLLLGLGIESAAAGATFFLPSPDTSIVGKVRVIHSRRQDTLLDIARRHDLGYNEIVEANPDVDPWLPGERTRIVLPTQFILPDAPRKGIVLNLAAMRLYYFPVPRKGAPPEVITYPIGIGRLNWNTPVGATTIVSKTADPVWHVPASIRKEHALEGEALPEDVPAGPDNPLGQFAMYLGISGYLIHGTDKPYGIGRRVSHGCVHLYPEDIAKLFRQVRVGTKVRFVDQPLLAGWLHGDLYLEAHQPLAESRYVFAGDLTPVVETVIRQARPGQVEVNWKKALSVARQARSLPVRISSGAMQEARR